MKRSSIVFGLRNEYVEGAVIALIPNITFTAFTKAVAIPESNAMVIAKRSLKPPNMLGELVKINTKY